MGGMKCGRLRQPVMQCLEGEWAATKQETRNDGGGTRQGMVQEDDEGESKEWRGNKVRVPAFWIKVGH